MKGRSESLVKITRPRSRKVFLRTGLLAKLDKALESPAVWISSPPGSGKSTLVSSYLKVRNCVSIWYHVDKNDYDVASFFWYLRLAAREFAPHEYEQLPAYTSAYRIGLEVFSLRYFEKLYSMLGPEFVIVIDDLHLAQASEPLVTALTQAFTAMPACGGMIITSRTPLPQKFCRFRVNETLQCLGWEDLRLSSEEVHGIAKIHHPDMADEKITQINERADGWAAGLVFAMQNIDMEPVTNSLYSGNYYEVLFGYFANELFDKQSPEQQNLLMKLALLPHMTQAMAREFSGSEQAVVLLKWLDSRNYFVELRKVGVPIYRFHPLFREFLLHKLTSGPDKAAVLKLCQRGAEVLENNGYNDAAFKLYQSSGFWVDAVRLIQQDAAEKYRQGRVQNIVDQIILLPDEVIADEPWLLFWLGSCKMFLDSPMAHQYFSRAFEAFQSKGDRAGALSAWAGAVNSLMTEWGDVTEIDRWIELGEKLFDEGEQGSLGEVEEHATVAMCFALFLCRPHSPSLEGYMQKTHAYLVSSDNETFSLMGGNLLTLFYGWQGDVAKLSMLLDALRPRATMSSAHQVMWAGIEHWHTLISGNPADCLKGVANALELAESSGVHIFDYRFVGMSAQACLMLGQVDEAHTHIKNYLDIAPPRANLIRFHAHYLSAWESWSRGKHEDSMSLLRLGAEFLRIAGSPRIISAKASIAKAILHLDRGEAGEAKQCLDVARRTATLTGSTPLLYQSCLVDAWGAHETGDRKAALKSLREGLQIASQSGLLTVDWWSDERMERLLSLALDNDIECDHVRRIIAVSRLKPAGAARLSDTWPWYVRVRLFGDFMLEVRGRDLTEQVYGQRKVAELLKLLVVCGARGATTAHLADAIWPDAEGDDARNALKTTTHRLRKLLGSAKAVLLDGGRMSLNPEYCWSDVEAFTQLAKQPAANRQRARNVRQALRLYQGVLLPGCDAPWALTARLKLQHIEHGLVMEMGSRYERRCRWDKAIQVYLQGLETDATDEKVCRHLMTCYQRSGHERAAWTAYEQCREQLKITEARRPSRKTELLAKSILRH